MSYQFPDLISPDAMALTAPVGIVQLDNASQRLGVIALDHGLQLQRSALYLPQVQSPLRPQWLLGRLLLASLASALLTLGNRYSAN